ncbi:Glyoxalase/Bleomycin resistance protein/Dihydroxybiphenyl dioxygenase [Exophiala viscosa]|uniref:Glyoxalase/Bleomycin resistance protein/Dihydroxybiphenyl dioxygenase n=1 Tax=Exophiala viscosa TaxID=2486360 RepID=A0AAN6DYS5_9EURO|nr:Glyoxalase/Bleomycin resistance protein/Dihydroxybiphenyl dioxygenase [Exophiala viscosa]KAI1622549.1 Glyoxalase/Bleomycin resistance protein/Dihydroxybiphenyl dioxygenase [Exophiala viscosa]
MTAKVGSNVGLKCFVQQNSLMLSTYWQQALTRETQATSNLQNLPMSPQDIKCKFNHVGVAVDDLDAAVKWYTDTLGLHQIIAPAHMNRKQDPNGIVFRVYGSDLHEVKVAYLGFENQIGFEIFQFVDPPHHGGTVACPARFDAQAWTRGGFFHIAVTAAEPETLAQKVQTAGGKRVGKSVTLPNGETALYVQDPWGNVIEVCSADFKRLITS